MSSVRGATPPGGGRGNTSTTPRGRGQSRGRGLSNSASRGTPNTRGTLGQTSRPVAGSAPRGTNNARRHAPTPRASQRGAFGVASTRGNFQERYQALTKTRERERTDAIRQGLIADPDKPRSLSEAITPVGTCQDMCAEYERVQRVVQKDVWDEETDSNQSPFATTEKEPDESRMVKKFRRAAAGLEEQLPSDLRPPHVLKKTCDYLFEDVIGNSPSLAKVHHFVWDRTRAIRNDFSIQQVTRPDELRVAVECFERIARFHIVSLHQLALPEKPYSKYDWQQEREQLDRTLLSLMQFYDDCRGRIQLSNEAEFRAYCVIFQLQDPTPDLEDRVQTWPRHVIHDTRVQKALDLYLAACNVMDPQGPLKPRANHLIARQDWQRFWTLVASKQVSYLMGCVAEVYFNLVRRTVLNALFRTFRMNSSAATPDWTVDALCELLAFDDGDEVYAYCEQFGFSFREREDGQNYLDLTSVKGKSLPEPTGTISKQSKSVLVEDKRFGRTLSAVINGLAVKQAHDVGMIHEAEEEEAMEDVGMDGDQDAELRGHKDEVDDGESLFIPESKTQAPFFPVALDSARHEKPSPFSGLSSGSGFGKPSNVIEQSNPFAKQPPTITTPKTNTLGPVNTTASAGIFNIAASGAESARTAAPIFDFSQDSTTDDTRKNVLDPKQFSFGEPSKDSKSVFASNQAGPPKSSPFSFTPPLVAPSLEHNNNPNNFSSAPISFAAKPDPKTSLEEQTRPPFTLGQSGQPAAPSVTQVPLPSFSTQSETKGPQPQAPAQLQFGAPTSTTTPNSNTSTPQTSNQPPATSLGVKRASFSSDNKPRKPSPLSNSFTANDDSSAIKSPPTQPFAHWQSHPTQPAVADTASELENTPEPIGEDFEATVARLTDEFLNDPCRGFLKQYIDFAVENTIKEVKEQIETERLNAEANELRAYHLQRRVVRRLKETFWKKRIAKSGRERRERRQRRLHQRQFEGVKEDNFPLESQSVGGSSQVGSVVGSEASFADLETRENNPIKQQNAGNSRHIREPPKVAGSKRPMSSHGTGAPVPSRDLGHKRLKSTSHIDERGRVAKPTVTSHPHADLLKRSSFLGFAVPDGASNDMLKNRTTTNYFKLKAMGIETSSHQRGAKRRSESVQTSSQTSPPALRSSVALEYSPRHSSTQALMPMPSMTPSRAQKTNDEDEALFARLKAARQTLNDNAAILKLEYTEHEERRMSTGSQSSNESPSMAKARADARLRASNPASDSGTSRSVPAYRLRESRFVPREHYSRAIERSKDFRESRSRETSRPESPFKQHELGLPANVGDASTKQPASIESQATQPPQNGLHRTLPNGNSLQPDEQRQTPASNSKPFSSTPQAPISFADHTTQMSSQNPFLLNTVPDSFGSIVNPPNFGFTGSQVNDQMPLDQTIRPSQIDKSLERSFGSSYGANNHAALHGKTTPPKQDSYLHSQAISLLSDDEDDEDDAPAQPTNHQQLQNTIGTDDRINDLHDETVDDDDDHLRNSYGHTNPFAALTNQSEYYEDDDSQEWDNHVEGPTRYDKNMQGAGYSSDEDEETNGIEYEDEDGVDADVEDEEELDEDHLQHGYADEYGDEYDTEIDEDEGEGGYDYDSEDEEEDAEPQHPQYDPRWAARPPKNPELQNVGNTAEEAIELSD